MRLQLPTLVPQPWFKLKQYVKSRISSRSRYSKVSSRLVSSRSQSTGSRLHLWCALAKKMNKFSPACKTRKVVSWAFSCFFKTKRFSARILVVIFFVEASQFTQVQIHEKYIEG